MFIKNKIYLYVNVIGRYLRGLDQLQKTIFSTYINNDYTENSLYYEQKIYYLKMRLLILMKKICKTKKYQSISDKLSRLFEILLSLNMLKYRVDDNAIFDMCKNELNELSATLSAVILIIEEESSDKHNRMQYFMSAIESLEDLYRSILQVSCREPLAFLFFIEDLRVLHESI